MRRLIPFILFLPVLFGCESIGQSERVGQTMLQQAFADMAPTVQDLLQRSQEAQADRRPDQAMALARQALTAAESAPQGSRAAVEQVRSYLAALTAGNGDFDTAEALLKKSVANLETDTDKRALVDGLGNLGALYMQVGGYYEAERSFRRSVTTSETVNGRESVVTARELNNLGVVYQAQGRLAKARPLFEDALAIRRKLLPASDADIATSLHNLAVVRFSEGSLADAERLFKEAVEIRDASFGSGHPDTLASLQALAEVLIRANKYDEAGRILGEIQPVIEQNYGSTSSLLAQNYATTAGLHQAEGQYQQAVAPLQQAVLIYEKVYGAQHPKVAELVHDLAGVYLAAGRFEEAEPLYKRTLEIWQKAYGADHPDVATTLHNLASVYQRQGNLSEAEQLYTQALKTKEMTLGANHPQVAESLNNLAGVQMARNQVDAAERNYQRALAIWEASPESNRVNMAKAYANIASVFRTRGQPARALPLYEKSLALMTGILGEGHPDLAKAMANLALVNRDQGNLQQAAEAIRGATAVYRTRLRQLGASGDSESLAAERRQVRQDLILHLDILADLHQRATGDGERRRLFEEMFEVAQSARSIAVDQAISRMAVRFASGDQKLADLVRRREDLVAQSEQANQLLLAALGGTEASDRIGGQRQRLEAIAQDLAALDQQLDREFPDFAELKAPRPVLLGELRRLLKPDEALLSHLVAPESVFVFAVGPNGESFHRAPLRRGSLQAVVAVLRGSLDPSNGQRPFDHRRANALYRDLVAPVSSALGNANLVFVVPDDALESLPYAVMVTAPLPTGGADRTAAWLIRDHALATLPSLSSLRALRELARGSPGSRPFGGFGDPILAGHPDFRAGGIAGTGRVNIETIRQIPALPETADELRAMAGILGAGPDDLFLGQRFTRSVLTTVPLADYRILAFSTHGLIARNLPGLTEPALVLTPPDQPRDREDDGLLTAGDVTGLKLNADWVILSACNTAAADGSPRGEGLSGLAKAFFYAGARALLVSHWPVESNATVELTTKMLDGAVRQGLPRAEALRRSMLKLIDSNSYSHPMFWAPFVVAGEGGRV